LPEESSNYYIHTDSTRYDYDLPARVRTSAFAACNGQYKQVQIVSPPLLEVHASVMPDLNCNASTEFLCAECIYSVTIL